MSLLKQLLCCSIPLTLNNGIRLTLPTIKSSKKRQLLSVQNMNYKFKKNDFNYNLKYISLYLLYIYSFLFLKEDMSNNEEIVQISSTEELITIPLILGATLTTLVQSDERQRSCWLTIANDMKTIFPTLDCFINNSGAICDLITNGFSDQERLFINKVYPHRLKDDPPDSEETVIAKAVKRKLIKKRNNYRDRLQLYMFRNDHSQLVTFYI